MAVEDDIQFERDGHIARVWFNRPHKRNCITVPMLHRLDEIITEIEGDDEIRAVVVRGRGNTFSSGFDLDSLQSDFIGSSTAMDVAVVSAKVCDRFYNMSKPSVAVLEGYVTAGGFEVMISCDFAIADDAALIGDFHIRRALFGGAGPIYRLPRMIGIRKTKELMLTGKLLTGQEAAAFDLVNTSAPADQLDATVEEFVSHLTDKSPFQMKLTKMAVDRGLDADIASLMVLEHLAVGVTLNSDDAAEGVSAFLEKRDPKWTGR
ncbi:enoyl-CoA hydratase/isomerase family protein [Actinomycetospora sp. NBRC 106378]|jgi:enoyl-CoA hydratase|uniref:enoyl-CoA hydratase/isomerase family protein n=1 Tax=Actinomycetospora sp. NBRC 106378 TaxID=3032208 RepID=UPI0024A156F0|nr:enoyl-CoA hydratase/isomerase family protein [Actinomycetospora sp. NBRC 106378]GLZ52558.1 crotonase [Actinomycetospora sp. NBRC 106378]